MSTSIPSTNRLAEELPIYAKKDFVSDQTVRWCPGCGDYAILDAVQKVFAGLGIRRENFVVVSGIGCSSRLPYYVNTYGFHTIHGRAPAVATGIKVARPELSVWVATGDGDALSIGGNHLLHALRRNVDLKILLFNNKIYGLTKGQYSPTSEIGTKTKTTPFGSVDRPVQPISLALAAEATFVARTVDVHVEHLRETIARAAAHRGSTFIEILQNCPIFNDGVFTSVEDRKTRPDNCLELVHGEALRFGKNMEKGIRMNGVLPEVVELGNGISEGDLLRHDESNLGLSFMLSRLPHPGFPVLIGGFRAVKEETYEDAVHRQIRESQASRKPRTLDELLRQGEVWQAGMTESA